MQINDKKSDNITKAPEDLSSDNYEETEIRTPEQTERLAKLQNFYNKNHVVMYCGVQFIFYTIVTGVFSTWLIYFSGGTVNFYNLIGLIFSNLVFLFLFNVLVFACAYISQIDYRFYKNHIALIENALVLLFYVSLFIRNILKSKDSILN